MNRGRIYDDEGVGRWPITFCRLAPRGPNQSCSNIASLRTNAHHTPLPAHLFAIVVVEGSDTAPRRGITPQYQIRIESFDGTGGRQVDESVAELRL